MEFARFFIARTSQEYLWLGALFCFVLAAELAFPRGRLPPRTSRIRVLRFAAVFIPLAAICSGLSYILLPPFTPLLATSNGGFVGSVAGVVAYLLIGEFCYYWFHRLQHSVPFLWRFHAVHHSVEEMAAGANYHHILDSAFKLVLVAIPTALLVSPEYVAVIAVAIALHGYYNHSATALNFGPIAYLIPDNRTHRIHHSRDACHVDKNFGGVTLIWDHVFRTAYIPRDDEWPETGLADQSEPQTVVDYLVRPFKRAPVTSYKGARAA